MLTAAQICTQVSQIVKAPGMLSQTGQCLNTVLVSLALQQDLDLVRRATTITLTTGSSPSSYALPSNYLRARRFFYYVNGDPFDMYNWELEDLLLQYQNVDAVDFPYAFATDTNTATNLIYVYPNPVEELTATLIYFDVAVEITTPETSATIPWFPDQDFLIKETSSRMMQITDDTRAPLFKQMSDETLRRTSRNLNDPERKAKKILRDPMTFRNVQNVKPTKIEGGW